MATSASRLENNLFTRLKAVYRTQPPANQELNEDYFLRQLAKAIAEEVLTEITTFARCSGQDSDGDTHDNVQIV